MKLQILIPHYHEPAEVVKPLLDSIAIQQNADFSEVGVVICHDGEDIPDLRFPKYPFEVKQVRIPHGGVSAARNGALDAATADYVMFCDCDDMFFNACGLWIVFNEIENGFDSLTTAFAEEVHTPEGKVMYVNHEMDSTFVHGKIHRRKFLIDNNIRWNPSLTIHEDSYFNILCQRVSPGAAKYLPSAFYLWRWRDESVCRHDPKYILKTYNNMLDSNTALVDQFLQRGRMVDAQWFAVSMIYDAYFTLNKDEWINQENQEYRRSVEKRFAEYFKRFEILFTGCDKETRAKIIVGIKNRMFNEGLLLETQTFDQWINHIKEMT